MQMALRVARDYYINEVMRDYQFQFRFIRMLTMVSKQSKRKKYCVRVDRSFYYSSSRNCDLCNVYAVQKTMFDLCNFQGGERIAETRRILCLRPVCTSGQRCVSVNSSRKDFRRELNHNHQPLQTDQWQVINHSF